MTSSPSLHDDNLEDGGLIISELDDCVLHSGPELWNIVVHLFPDHHWICASDGLHEGQVIGGQLHLEWL